MTWRYVFSSFAEAITHANWIAYTTGIRQKVSCPNRMWCVNPIDGYQPNQDRENAAKMRKTHQYQREVVQPMNSDFVVS